MCKICQRDIESRRAFLRLGAASAIALSLGGLSQTARAPSGPATALTPDEAIAALRSGNERYLNDPQVCTNELAQRRQEVAPHQAPWATIIACADSRVPPELIFGGLGLGELFVARNAGNLVDTATMGTIEYGAAVLGSAFIVGVAPTSCGARG